MIRFMSLLCPIWLLFLRNGILLDTSELAAKTKLDCHRTAACTAHCALLHWYCIGIALVLPGIAWYCSGIAWYWMVLHCSGIVLHCSGIAWNCMVFQSSEQEPPPWITWDTSNCTWCTRITTRTSIFLLQIVFYVGFWYLGFLFIICHFWISDQFSQLKPQTSNWTRCTRMITTRTSQTIFS